MTRRVLEAYQLLTHENRAHVNCHLKNINAGQVVATPALTDAGSQSEGESDEKYDHSPRSMINRLRMELWRVETLAASGALNPEEIGRLCDSISALVPDI